MALALDEERNEDEGCHSTNRPPAVPKLQIGVIQPDIGIFTSEFQDVRRPSSNSLPPVHTNTCREREEEKVRIEAKGNQTARIRFAPPPRSKQPMVSNCVRPGRTHLTGPSATFCNVPNKLQLKRETTARSFNALENWGQSIESGVLKNLLTEVYDVLVEAAYNKASEVSEVGAATPSPSSPAEDLTVKTIPEEQEMIEYFSLVTDMQKKLKAKQEGRKRLATQLAMEKALEQDLSAQLQRLEQELAQLHMRHFYNRAEIEGERRAVQILERDYASLTEQETEALRDCEVLELQLETQRVQLRETRSQQLYLDFVSSAPLKKHMEEKKWQEQHAAVALQVQNADAENRAIEDEIKKLEEETDNLESQYAREVQSKQQAETALTETRANYEQFQEAFERTRVCYTPRPDWDRIVDATPELSIQRNQWEVVDSTGSRGVAASIEDSEKDKGGILQRLNSISAAESEQRSQNKGRTTTLVKEMLHWIERLQKHCGVNLHLSRIWHDVEEARVELNILHHQLDRAVRKTSMIPVVLPNASGIITIAAPTSPSSGSPPKPRQNYIMALGLHDGIPLFLRHRGKLKRRVLKKIDVEKVVRKVWVEKRKREQWNPLGRFPLEQVLYEKLHRKYGFQPLIAEWGYNLLLALQMFSWDSEIEMFLLCLTGAVSDLVYVDQEQMIQGCKQLLLRLCELYHIESFVLERRVLLKDALVALRTYFPLKTSAQLQAIEQSIIRDMHKMKRGGNDSILYIEDILPLDVKYPLGFFVKTIRTQHFKEIQDYYALLQGELEQRDTDQRGILPLAAVRDAIMAIDPLADPGNVKNLMMKALNVKTRAHLHMREPVHYKAVLRKLNATCLMKFALNFDQNAEVNWRRRPGVVYVDTPAENSKQNRKSTQRKKEA